ncbi:MAG: tellurite resistance/C4-dicarboxylate transporter family protein [Candidatus Dormibacteraceae bacterium]
MANRFRDFSPIMAGGILSVAAARDGQPLLSAVLLDLAVAVFLAVLASNLLRAVSRPKSILIGKDGPHAALVLFTWVAACGVLGARLASLLPAAPYIFGGLATLGWIGAIAISAAFVLNQFRDGAANAVRGSWLLAVVATQSLSILAGTDVGELGSRVAIDLSFGFWALGLALYLVLIMLIVRRLVRGEVGLGDLTPDYWITMGALAISTVGLTDVLHGMGGSFLSQVFAGAVVATWLGGAAWVPYLCVAEILRVRRRGAGVSYNPLRWSTVFPLGMFSLATFDFARTIALPFLNSLAQLAFWAGLALALLNTTAAVRAVAGANRRTC